MKTSEFNALRAEMRAMLAEQGYTKEILKEQTTEVLNKTIYDAVKHYIIEHQSEIERMIAQEIKSNINRELRTGVKQAILEKFEDSDYIRFGTNKKGGEQ